eukprot:GFKZ01005198.1.p1 GENE.GFKZ01005198.1~~GFKZ01005198.1.p1  ORF type:complete len:499 (+),score=68.47 GFKZ01005198.1:158-1498(+)
MDSAASSSHLPILSKRAVTYNTLPSRRRSDVTPPPVPALSNRHSSDAVLMSRHLSGLSDIGASMCTGQLTLLHNGVSLGLDGYSSYLNYLLVFVPLGFAAHLFNADPVYVFAFSFIGMIPLAMLLGKATEDIAEHTNETMGALVNVTFGNAVELILSIAALQAGKLELIQNTIAGSVLSNLLLVLGSAFFFGGLRYREQIVLPAVSEANADLLSFAVFGFSIPALFAMAMPEGDEKQAREERMSLVTSVCLLVIYCMYLLFQLYTHAEWYEVDGVDGVGDVEMALGAEEEEQVASLPVAMGILVFMVLLVAGLSELIVTSIDGFSGSVGVGQKFIAVVLLPVIGNAVEHMSAILVARHNKIDLSIGIACGSSVQIALFAAPLLVVVSWLVGGEHLTLNFELFETICIGFSVFVVNATLRDSRSNWLEGALLMMCYFILAAAFYFMG